MEGFLDVARVFVRLQSVREYIFLDRFELSFPLYIEGN